MASLGLLLGEQLTPRALLGCALMLAGILISQLWPQSEANAAEKGPGSRDEAPELQRPAPNID